MLSLGYVGSQHIAKNLSSKNQISARQEAALNIAKHVISDTCWSYNADDKLKIGDRVLVKGSETGKIPTSCVYNKPTKQFVEVAYLDKELQAIRIFSIKEIQASRSNLLAGGTN
ncbi:MAG: hypothetical protein AAF063_09210 [Cyanobacteria bacterium J06643_5]